MSRPKTRNSLRGQIADALHHAEGLLNGTFSPGSNHYPIVIRNDRQLLKAIQDHSRLYLLSYLIPPLKNALNRFKRTKPTP